MELSSMPPGLRTTPYAGPGYRGSARRRSDAV
jgi:hypothetical protein